MRALKTDRARFSDPKPNRPLRTFFAAAAILASSLVGSAAFAAGDVLIVQMGEHTFYIPKSWWGRGISGELSRREVTVDKEGRLQEIELFIRPQPDWKPYGRDDLPEILSVRITDSPPSASPRLLEQTKKRIEYANTHDADQYGFVRVFVSSHKERNGEPYSETLILKGYLNEVGYPLIVNSENHDYPGGSRSLSDVSMIMQPGLGLRYLFSNRQFPESEWVQMHRRVLDFVNFLQVQK